MTRRWRTIAWAVTTLALFGILAWAYRRFVLLHPDPTLTWVRNGVSYELLNPKMLAGVLLAPWFVAVLAKSLADLPWPQRVLSVLLRITFVALIAIGLSRLARSATTEKVCTVYLVDVSESVPDEALGDAREALAKAYAEKPADGVIKVITFARRPHLVEPAEGDDPKKPPPITRHIDAPKPGAPPRPEGQRGAAGAGSHRQAGVVYTNDPADELDGVDMGGGRII